jgi:hypothetical protein
VYGLPLLVLRKSNTWLLVAVVLVAAMLVHQQKQAEAEVEQVVLGLLQALL